MKQKKKSPIKDKPLRYVGQSLDERIIKLINEDAVPYIIVGFMMVCFAGYEWWRYFKNPSPHPITVSFAVVIIVLFCAYRVKKIFKQVKAVKLGRDGERAVGQYLENLREKGHRIFHDLLGDNFNLDHVIISRKGIYVIETKTYSKPAKGEAKIGFDGEKLTIKDFEIQSKPIIQVKAASNWLKNILLETTGKSFLVKPVILFPGWYI
ncbi:NERD domain-containing protein, partial [Patescibacteria group bacterium]|nr:NERD domain-containing protein [Patescibacteria group bacterium]